METNIEQWTAALAAVWVAGVGGTLLAVEVARWRGGRAKAAAVGRLAPVVAGVGLVAATIVLGIPGPPAGPVELAVVGHEERGGYTTVLATDGDRARRFDLPSEQVEVRRDEGAWPTVEVEKASERRWWQPAADPTRGVPDRLRLTLPPDEARAAGYNEGPLGRPF